MPNTKINVTQLKKIVSKMNMAVEKTTINPQAAWVELETVNNKLFIKISNSDYYLESCVDIQEVGDNIHPTVTAETFIPLIAKLEDEIVEMFEENNALIITTKNNRYTLPVIKESGVTKHIDTISFDNNNCTTVNMTNKDLMSVADANGKGLVDAVFTKEIQQYIYVDEVGAITFTENIYVNNFDKTYDKSFAMLLNGAQVRLLKIFERFETINVSVANVTDNSESVKVKLADKDNTISIIFITQNKDTINKFPSTKLREYANKANDTHIIIDKNKLDKALSRLMVFDKKFDITVMNYSKFVFGADSVKLVSVKNHNFEVLSYNSAMNVIEKEFIIRFADIVAQLKAITSDTIDISYGDSPVLVINGNIKQLIPGLRA